MRIDVGVLRFWGLAASATAMAVALAVAWSSPAAPVTAAKSEVGVALRFRGAGPIARAQARADAGEREFAVREIARQLQRQSEFAGLCFAGFTPAAEVVLRACAGAEAANESLIRLRAMSAVVSARPLTLNPDAKQQ